MNRKMKAAVLCAALGGWIPMAGAQGIYRCGDSYSQQPCPGGKRVEADDARSAAQKAQTDQAVRRDAKAAEALEKERLKDEAKPAQLVKPPAAPQEAVKPTAASSLKKPDQFTAVAPKKPGDTAKKKKKKATKKAA
jgi:hypothetical protein